MSHSGWVKSPTSDPKTWPCCVYLRRNNGLIEFCATEIPNQPELAFGPAEVGKFFDQLADQHDVQRESFDGAIQVQLAGNELHMFHPDQPGRILRITQDEWTAFCDGVCLGFFDFLRDQYDGGLQSETANAFVSL